MAEGSRVESDPVETFIARWSGREGGQERANYALFLTELCDLLGVPHPEPAHATREANDYVFERVVNFSDGAYGRIDLYKRGCFVLEAKQSRVKGAAKAIAGQDDFFAAEETDGRRGRADRAWDVLMLNARRQAEDYARALPAAHDWPPFILVCDVGHCIEVFADFTGKGRNYTQFPDRKGFRVYLEDLRDEQVRDRLRLIWTKPQALDPTRIAAEATRGIARRLAEVSRSLEARGIEPQRVAHFLMRCLFTMFAEDVGLLPKESFKQLLERCRERPNNFARMVGQLWEAMNSGGFAYALEADVKRFNGAFFRNATALELEREEIGELLEAAKANWRSVEPAIFGTLLEQALDAKERRRLGAHYTPRAYVERLVVATLIEPLREDWRNVLGAAQRLQDADKRQEAIAVVRAFHDTLTKTRVLDPACGTGNFLYVAMELMKRLEGEVLEALANLGGAETLALDRTGVDPHQFLGIEVNPRAAAIAELVLWIGYLQWHFRTRSEPPAEPILRAFRNIECRDAVLTWDGAPVPAVAGGRETYPNARRPDWPQAEFIIGNPPFIGGKDIRSRFGDGYTETLWRVNKPVNNSADFVMYWWDRAAELLTRKGSVLRRFGFVTTNSITQVFQRRVIERHLTTKEPISLLMAIPDHPWTKATRDAAAVRIAMTVAAPGKHDGVLREVVSEAGLDTDEPEIVFAEREGRINADLTVGVDVSATKPLKANEGLCSPGVKLHGDGFIITPPEAEHLGLGRHDGLERHIREYRNGRDLTAHSRGAMVIDLFGLEAEELRQRYPELYQHLLQAVKPERDKNNRAAYRQNWWIFGEPRRELRLALAGLDRYIATVETTKHRVFQFLDAPILPDNMLIAIALDDPFHLGALSSRPHVVWALAAGGWLGIGNDPRYSKSCCFDPFPFPDPVPDALKDRIRAAAEELDATRKRVLEAHSDLTLTRLYNVLEKLKSGAALDVGEEDVRERGLVLILKELHESIDRLVGGLWLARRPERRGDSRPPRRAQRRARGGREAGEGALAAARLPDPALRLSDGEGAARGGVRRRRRESARARGEAPLPRRRGGAHGGRLRGARQGRRSGRRRRDRPRLPPGPESGGPGAGDPPRARPPRPSRLHRWRTQLRPARRRLRGRRGASRDNSGGNTIG
jgi:hypothetical protein